MPYHLRVEGRGAATKYRVASAASALAMVRELKRRGVPSVAVFDDDDLDEADLKDRAEVERDAEGQAESSASPS